MKFVGKGQPLTRAGLYKALALLGLGINDAAYIWTVVEVETAGLTQRTGFRVDRRPQILFERHMFSKYTNGRFDGAAPDISGPAGGYGLLSEQHNKLEKALSICAKAKLGSEPALKSASWGSGDGIQLRGRRIQILRSNGSGHGAQRGCTTGLHGGIS